MLNIVCFKWGTLFGAEYVNKLYNSIQRNVTVPHNFICFTENPDGVECETRPFLRDLPTWWYIIGLFNKEHNFTDRVLYMDLDTVITNNIDHIVSLDTDFAITEDFYRPKGLQTTFIMYKPEKYHYMYDKLMELNSSPPPHYMGGTNGFVEKFVPREQVTILQDIFPKEFISYKVHIRDKNRYRHNHIPGSLDTAKVICFHGKPRPHEEKELPWMREHWK